MTGWTDGRREEEDTGERVRSPYTEETALVARDVVGTGVVLLATIVKGEREPGDATRTMGESSEASEARRFEKPENEGGRKYCRSRCEALNRST